MGLRINTNVAAMNATRILRTSTNDLNKSLQRLSSGLRINSAADDAAGLAIAEGFAAEYLIPFYFKNAFIVVKMKLLGPQSKDKTASRTFFTLTMRTEALGTVVAECSLVENIVSVELDTEAEQAMVALGAHQGELVQMLARDGFANANVTITMKSKSANLPKEEVQGGREKVISVVV